MEVHHAVAETAFVQQFKLQADIVGERLFAASHHDGREEQVALVDQPGLDRLGGKVGTAHADVTSAVAFICRTASGSKSRSIRVLALDTAPASWSTRSCRPPAIAAAKSRVDGRLVGDGVHGLPGDHHLVHPASVEVGADRPFEVVDEGCTSSSGAAQSKLPFSSGRSYGTRIPTREAVAYSPCHRLPRSPIVCVHSAESRCRYTVSAIMAGGTVSPLRTFPAGEIHKGPGAYPTLIGQQLLGRLHAACVATAAQVWRRIRPFVGHHGTCGALRAPSSPTCMR